MSTVVLVALIAGTFGTVAPIVSWLVARSAIRDLRVMVTKDIEILKQLDRNGEIAKRLSLHIEDSLSMLIMREVRRRNRALQLPIFIILGSVIVLCAFYVNYHSALEGRFEKFLPHGAEATLAVITMRTVMSISTILFVVFLLDALDNGTRADRLFLVIRVNLRQLRFIVYVNISHLKARLERRRSR